MIDMYDDPEWEAGLQKIWDDYDKWLEEERKEQEEKKRLEESFNRGIEAGQKQMVDRIQHQLRVIMDDIDHEHGISKENQYIVPMHKVFDGKCVEFKLLIAAKTPYEAWCIALAAFEYGENEIVGGWKVYPNYKEYERIK